jgi:hypothetical protein
MLKIIKAKAVEQDEFRYVEMDFGAKTKVGGRVAGYHSKLGEFVTTSDLYVTI